MLRVLRTRIKLKIPCERTACYYTVKSETKIEKIRENQLPKQLYMQMKSTGPITVAEYMKQVLIHPLGGYYVHKNAFGASGDFITSPEVSQMFGEMLAVWFLNEWRKVGAPKPLNIVEFGPGRGSLMQDLLRVFEQFKILQGACIHLIEISPLLADLQARLLCTNSKIVDQQEAGFYKEGLTTHGVPVRWYHDFSQVPSTGFTFLVAHEFFDALPIHKFIRKPPEEHREVLVDVDPSSEDSNNPKFRYVRSKQSTPVGKLFLSPEEHRNDVEVCPQALVLIKDIATRLEEVGGFALIVDYGHDGDGTDTFRAFRQHKQHDPLVEPGSADLTADVDFRMLRKAIDQQGGMLSFGPVTQREFLLAMGIRERVKSLQNVRKERAGEKNDGGGGEDLQKTLEFLTSDQHMGGRFKVLALLPKVLQEFLRKFPPTGFSFSD